MVIGSNWFLEDNKNGKKRVSRNAINIVTIKYRLQRIFSVYKYSDPVFRMKVDIVIISHVLKIPIHFFIKMLTVTNTEKKLCFE